MLRVDPTTPAGALRERICALATGGGGSFDPHPSAEFIGCCARAMIDVAASREYDFIAKGKVQTFRKRAEALHVDGIRATVGYQHFEALLTEMASIHPVLDIIFDSLRNASCSIYKNRRQQLAQDFVQLEHDLLTGAAKKLPELFVGVAPKRRGRPPGSGTLFDQEDWDIILAAAKQAKPSKNDLSDLIDNVLRERIDTLPLRGDKSQAENLRTHKRRIIRKINRTFAAKK